MSQSTGTSKPKSLAIGEEFHLKRGKDRIIYVGMSSKDIHSVVQKKVSGNRGYAWNLIYSTRRHDIVIYGVRLNIYNATPDEIKLYLM